MKPIFDILVMEVFVSDNILINFIVLGIVGKIVYKLSYFFVGLMGLKGIAGFVAHWTIRLVLFIVICHLIRFFIFAFDIAILILEEYYLSLVIFIAMLIGIYYSSENENSLLNKRIV